MRRNIVDSLDLIQPRKKYEIKRQDIYYQETDKLGEGGYGTVYKGKWEGKLVAIKIICCKLNGDLEKEFNQEIELMHKLHYSPYIVQIHGAVLNPINAIVMELMPKGSLYNLLRKEQNLEWSIKYQIALDIAYGIKHLHQNDILHRDLKSLNVLLGEDLTAKICDLGLAKVKNHSRTQVTMKSEGTLCWMAPELFDIKAKFSVNSDIYALGMVFYELLTHKIPFEDELIGQKAQQVLAKWIVQGKRPNLIGGGSEDFKKLITECWSQEFRMRPNTIKIVESLQKILETEKHPQQYLFTGPTYLPMTERPKSPSGEELYIQGNTHEKQQNFREAFNYYEKSMKKGYFKAFTQLGYLKLNGLGCDANKSEALDLFIKGAECGHSRAMINLAQMYGYADGVEQDYKKAYELAKQAMDTGDNGATALYEKFKKRYEDSINVTAPSYLGLTSLKL